MKKYFLSICLLIVAGANRLAANNNSSTDHRFSKHGFVYGDSLYKIMKCECGIIKSYHAKGASAIEILKLQNKDHKKGCIKREIIGYSMESKKKGDTTIVEVRNINNIWCNKIVSGKMNIYNGVKGGTYDVNRKYTTDVGFYIQKGDFSEPKELIYLTKDDIFYNLFSDNENAKLFLDSKLEKRKKLPSKDVVEAAKIYNGDK
ncbi:MAG TPA: hypothetical protein PKG90_10715 [Chitinophagaceae bacterium]|nr:hypothetical protein [Chitinophagaceae bacterium]